MTRVALPAVAMAAAGVVAQVALAAEPAALPASSPSPAVQTVEVIGTAPLPGQGVPRDALPYATQLLRRADIDGAGTSDAAALLARRAAGVQVADVQGSPLQGDLSFRGFRASGLLGAAQGLSVYLDGVRVNEAFGDIVSWDLLPDFALDTVALLPGANPAFGLNTLGGAIAMTTVDGGDVPGWRGGTEAGSHGRRSLDLSRGGADADGWRHYVGGSLFEEDGWRDHSPGRRGVLLGKLSRRLDAGEVGATLLAARSRLVGNGLVPLYAFDADDPSVRTPALGGLDRAAVYTHPDRTDNRAVQLSLRGTHALDDGTLLEALLHGRWSRRTTVNGDEADDDDDDGSDDDGDAALASLNRTATRQDAGGLSLGASGHRGAHRWGAGLSIDVATMRYRQTEQAGAFDATRGVRPLGAAEAEPSAAVRGRTRTLGLHVSDTWRAAADTHVTGTLRWNDAQVRSTLTRFDDGEGADRPTETFTYRHWNPALGVAHRAGAVTWFANAARNTRVPTVIELGCADPDEPCRLPAGLQADPFLKPVRTTSLEAGLRFGGARGHAGSLALYRLDNRDDILFASVSVAGQLGYFRNFPHTRHQGLDAEWRWRGTAWEVGVTWSRLQATYEAVGVLRVGERNVAVAPGTRIAGLPRDALKASAAWSPAPGWRVGGELVAVGRRVSAGNEDGRVSDDGDDGAARADLSIPGYALVHLHASWQAAPGVELRLGVDNLFDRRAASVGALAATRFDAAGAWTGDEEPALFAGPVAPRSLSVGLRWAF